MHELIKIVAMYFVAIPVLVVLYMLVVLPKRQRLHLLVSVLVGGVISLVLARIASHVYYDPRPFVEGHFTPLLGHAADNGFPSDHTLLAALLAWVVLRYSRKRGVTLLIVAALIGGARMAAGVHHLSDIVASFVLAGIGCIIAGWVSHKLVKTEKHAQDT